EIFGLLGPNGAGKTTLVRAIAGRVRLDRGTITLLGAPAAAGDAAARRSLGWVPQEIALYPGLTVRENLATFARYQGLDGSALADAIARALAWSGLAERAGDVTKTLSGGMKRRLNMAAGVIHAPSVILMDEPTVGVDPQSREKIYAMIEELRGRGVALLYTTHYMEEAERLCDTIAVIDHGRVIAAGTRDELVRQTVGERRDASIRAATVIPEPLAEKLRTRGAVAIDGRQVRLQINDPRREVEEIFRPFDEEGVVVEDLSLRAPTLETVFLTLTGRELRE
ncbi:MAG TPA: ABC transporter ATP-binding protein, partial [Thermoanaerobaculia bacterium]|nr:ABC transporter ATP-binding protein [Thermoanaerobaculia bacterium]